MVIKIEFRTWNHNNRPKSLSKQLIWIETKLFERRLSANQQWNVFLSVSAIMMSLYLALLDTFLPWNRSEYTTNTIDWWLLLLLHKGFLVFLSEGLCSSNPCRFEFSIFLGFRRNRTEDLNINSPTRFSSSYIFLDSILQFSCHCRSGFYGIYDENGVSELMQNVSTIHHNHHWYYKKAECLFLSTRLI